VGQGLVIRVRRYGEIVQLAMARTILGRPLFVVCAYAVDGLLWDTGPPAITAEFRRRLADLEIRQAVLSHAHEDHVGSNGVLAARGIVPRAHALALPALAHPPRLQLYRRIVWGIPAPSTAAVVEPDVATPRYHFRVLHTPGHSPDHLCLFEERRRWLFSGDLFLSPFVKVMRADEDPHALITSLRRVLALPVEVVLCSSGRIVEDGGGALRQKLDFLERLRDEARRRAARGQDADGIRRDLLGAEGRFRLVTGGHFSKQNLIDALLREAPAGP